jgi:hypothetical protein
VPVVAAVLTEGYNQLALSFIVGISVKRCTVRVALLLATLAYSVAALPSPPSWAYRDYFTPEQKALLDKIQTLRIETNALTDKGTVDPAPITELVARRMGELGYTVVGQANKPYDVVIKVKCEERKIWEGTTASGGDADLPDAPSRLWKGPACQMTYLLGTLKVKWQKEVRTEIEDAELTAQSAHAGDPGAYAMGRLKDVLETYEFPLLLAAEWGQPERLLKLLDRSDTPQARKLKIISLLGEMQADEALPKLKEVLKDRDLAKQAIGAMGNLGRENIPLLVEIMNASPDIEVQTAAAKGLGQLGGLHGDASVVPPLLAKLKDPKTDWSVLTEVAWSLGKIPDKRSIQPLYDLDRKLQAMRDPENVQLKKLKEAVFWAIKQCDTWDQFS